MKKMYFFLSLCLAMIGLTANAQIASLSELSNEKCYAVSNARTSWATSATALKTIKDLGVTADETSPAQQFAFVTNDEGATYYLYSVGQSKFVNLDGSLGNKPVNPINFKTSGGKFVMYFDASHYINCGGSSQMIIDGWNIADEGNMCDIKAVADFDPTAALAAFNAVDEAEVAANLEAAEAALAKAGVGYPTADCGTRTALVAAVDAAKAQVTAETASALSAALNTFLAETNVTLPETGKYYTFTMVAKNGNKFYLNYTGADVAMTAVTGEELPESAKFLATANGDGTYTFQTSDGNYLVYHTKYAGVNWLEGGGNTTGFQAEKDDMTNITLAKLSAAATNVSATDAQVFGLVSWYGKRGYDTSKNEDAMGYMVLKTDGTDYDGANAPFWNDNYSSAFLVEEAEVATPETPEVPNAELAETYTGTCNINFMGAPTDANVSLDFDKDSEGNAKAGYAYLLFSHVELGPVFNAEVPYEVKGNTVVLKGIEVATGENSDDTKEVDLTFTVQEDGKLLSNDQVYGPGFLSSILFDFSQCPLSPKSDVVEPEQPEQPEVPAGPVVITDVAQLSNAKCYTLVSSDTGRGGMYALADKVDMCGVTYNAGTDACHSVALDNADPKQQFAFVAYEGKLYLYSVSEKKFVMKSGDTNALVGEAPFEHVVVEKVGENTFALQANGTHYFTASPGWCANPERGTCIQSTLDSHSSDNGWDNGAWYTITEVADFDATEALAMLAPAPVEPTTVVAVDPACGHYEVMPATIKVTFSQEIGALTFSRIGTDIGSDAYTLTANDLNINGKEVSFTVPAQYVDGARKMLIMLAIQDTNGNPVSYSSNEDTEIEGYVMLEYTAESKPAATPLELVSVDPADGAELESVSKFTFTFNKPVTLGEEGGVVLYVNGEPGGQLEGFVSEEDAKVVTFVTEKEISNSGKYMLYVAPATFVDADGNTNEEMKLNYQVKAAVNSFTYAYVTPAQHQVQKSLKVLTIGFIGEVQDVVLSKSINVVDAEGKTVTTAKLGLDDYDLNAVIVTFKDEITAPGQYSITIPEEYVFSWEQTYNPEFTLTFTIEGEKQPLEIVSVDPAKGSVIPAISMVKITFNQEVTVPKMFGNAKLYYNGTYFDDPALYVDKTDAKVVYIDIQSEYKNKATWSFEIKPGAIVTKDGTPCEEILLSYEVGDITCINGISVEQMNDVYTLDGRKVVVTPGQKIKKGLYIVGGKKVYVK